MTLFSPNPAQILFPLQIGVHLVLCPGKGHGKESEMLMSKTQFSESESNLDRSNISSPPKHVF